MMTLYLKSTRELKTREQRVFIRAKSQVKSYVNINKTVITCRILPITVLLKARGSIMLRSS